LPKARREEIKRSGGINKKFWPPKDANDALRLEPTHVGPAIIRELIASATRVSHPKITSFKGDEELRFKVFDGERDPFSGGGVLSPSFGEVGGMAEQTETQSQSQSQSQSQTQTQAQTQFPSLDSITKGWRPGELCVVSGGTGGGKTTFMSQITVDIARYFASLTENEKKDKNGKMVGDWKGREGGVLWGR